MAKGRMVDEAHPDRGPAGGFDEVGLERCFVHCPAGDCVAICREGMKTSLSSMLAMSGWRVSIQTLRRSAMSGRRISLASSVFFMAEAKPVQPSADRTAMHRHALNCGQFGHHVVQRQVTLDRQPIPQPATVRGQLACSMIALRLGHKTACLAFEDHHVIHKARRHPKVPRRLSMTMPLFNKGDDAAAKFNRM